MTWKKKCNQWLFWRVRQAVGRLSQLLPRRPKPIRRILCLLSGGLGDRLMALPALRFLQQKYPEASLCVAWLDGGLSVTDAEFDTVVNFLPGETWRKIRLARQGFDLCFVNTVGIHSVWSEVCALVSGASVRMGPISAHMNPHQSVYNYPYVLEAGTHETILNCAGAGWSGTDDALAYPLCVNRLPARRTQIGLHVGCSPGYEMKRWALERYQALIQTLDQEQFFEFALLGDRSEQQLMERIAQGCDQASIHVLAKLDDFIDRIRQCHLFVGNDSGLCHLAAALNVPTVTLMGPTNPAQCRPAFSRGQVIQAHCPENFCLYSGAPCRRCLDTISAEAVAEVVKSLCREEKPMEEEAIDAQFA